MSGKKLLAENTIRQFMKLANIGPLTNNFIAENYEEEEEPLEEEMDEEDMGEEELEVDMGEEELEVDMGAEEEPAMGAADMSLTEEEAQLLVSLGDRLATALEGSTEDDGMPEIEDEAPVDDEVPELEDEAPLEDEEEAPGMRYENREALVQEIMKRVTKRIISARKSRK